MRSPRLREADSLPRPSQPWVGCCHHLSPAHWLVLLPMGPGRGFGQLRPAPSGRAQPRWLLGISGGGGLIRASGAARRWLFFGEARVTRPPPASSCSRNRLVPGDRSATRGQSVTADGDTMPLCLLSGCSRGGQRADSPHASGGTLLVFSSARPGRPGSVVAEHTDLGTLGPHF